jgi:hypothetical protein
MSTRSLLVRSTFRFFLAGIGCLGLASPAAATGFFSANLSDAENVPPFMSPTDARGRITIRSFRSLRYNLHVSNLLNAFAAHIHCGEVGEAGPIGVTLFQMSAFQDPPLPDSAITLNGTLAHGKIEAPDPGNACGWIDLDDVVDALRSGDTYVNIHTLQSPPGEIRGQID